MNSVKGNVKKLTAAEAKARVKAATASFIIDNVCNWSNHNGFLRVYTLANYPMKINRESKITRFLVKNKKWEDALNQQTGQKKAITIQTKITQTGETNLITKVLFNLRNPTSADMMLSNILSCFLSRKINSMHSSLHKMFSLST